MRRFALLLVLLLATALVHGQSSPPPEPQAPASGSSDASDQLANQVLREFKRGLETHSSRRFLSAFDPDSFDGYLAFADQVQQFFRIYDPIVIHYGIVQSSVDADHAVALIELQMEAAPSQTDGPSIRRDRQMRLTFTHTKKGWKISSLEPANFFVP